MASLTLSVFEIVILFISAVVVGVVIHLFITSRRNLKNEMEETKQNPGSGIEEWRMKYIHEAELKDKEISNIKNQLTESDENNRIYQTEITELKNQIRRLELDLQQSKIEKPVHQSKPDYYEQLRQAQQSLMDHNAKISQLLEQVDMIKETEEKNQEIQKDNEELSTQINDLKYMLEEKEVEIGQIKKKEHLTKEMSSMLDNAYSEFTILQSKIQKLESQLASSKMINIEYEDLKEAYYKMARDMDESKNKINHFIQENQALQIEVAKLEDKLSDANHQKQQLQKKVSYLEELNHDLQLMSDANKKLEGQIKRLGELESMLNIVSEERDKLKEQRGPGL